MLKTAIIPRYNLLSALAQHIHHTWMQSAAPVLQKPKAARSL